MKFMLLIVVIFSLASCSASHAYYIRDYKIVRKGKNGEIIKMVPVGEARKVEKDEMPDGQVIPVITRR